MKISAVGVLIALTTLSACQTAAEFEAQRDAGLEAVFASFPGMTLAQFEARNPEFAPVRADGGPSDRVFVYETAPVLVTTTTPGYTPVPRARSGSQIGKSLDDLNAAMHSTPSISRSQVQVCRATFVAAHNGNGLTSADWVIQKASYSGKCY